MLRPSGPSPAWRAEADREGPGRPARGAVLPCRTLDGCRDRAGDGATAPAQAGNEVTAFLIDPFFGSSTTPTRDAAEAPRRGRRLRELVLQGRSAPARPVRHGACCRPAAGQAQREAPPALPAVRAGHPRPPSSTLGRPGRRLSNQRQQRSRGALGVPHAERDAEASAVHPQREPAAAVSSRRSQPM